MGNLDVLTIVLYVGMGFVASFYLGRAQKYLDSVNGINIAKKGYKKNVRVFLIVFVFFATFRQVGYKIGGMDTQSYIDDFIQSTQLIIGGMNRTFSEPLFQLYTHLIRVLTDDYRVYFAITYFIICYAYVRFIKEYGTKNCSAIPLICITFLYLKSFNTLRTSLAVAMFLFALVYIEKRKSVSIIFLIAAILVHRISIVFTLVFVFYYFFKTYLSKMSKTKFTVFVVIFTISSVFIASRLQSVLLTFNWISGTDLWYLSRVNIASLLDKWPMFFTHLLLLFVLLFIEKSNRFVKADEKVQVLKIFFAFDMIMLPSLVLLGIWRANEYFYIVRLLLWGYVVSCGEKFFNKRSRFIYRGVVSAIFVAWLVFRILSEGDDMGILYYRLAG